MFWRKVCKIFAIKFVVRNPSTGGGGSELSSAGLQHPVVAILPFIHSIAHAQLNIRVSRFLNFSFYSFNGTCTLHNWTLGWTDFWIFCVFRNTAVHKWPQTDLLIIYLSTKARVQFKYYHYNQYTIIWPTRKPISSELFTYGSLEYYRTGQQRRQRRRNNITAFTSYSSRFWFKVFISNIKKNKV